MVSARLPLTRKYVPDKIPVKVTWMDSQWHITHGAIPESTHQPPLPIHVDEKVFDSSMQKYLFIHTLSDFLMFNDIDFSRVVSKDRCFTYKLSEGELVTVPILPDVGQVEVFFSLDDINSKLVPVMKIQVVVIKKRPIERQTQNGPQATKKRRLNAT